jgi:peptidoglycan/xylan/chitin deacetylase (PgdA/CDA1 family)
MKKRIAFITMLLIIASSQMVLAASGIVNTVSTSLYVRQSPSRTASIIGSLPKNTKVNTRGETNGFYKISYNGKTGYVCSSFIKLVKTTTASSKIPVLMYHRLTTDPHKTDSLTILQKTFSEHMNYLKAHGYNTISIDQLYSYRTKNTPLPKKPVMITFDDGYVSNYTMAYPILKANKQKATVFMIANEIDIKSDALTSKQLKEMDVNNFRVESHTNKHENLATLTYAEQLATITKAKQTLEKLLGRRVRYLAYPFGAYNSNTKNATHDAGYKLGISTDAGFTSKQDNRYTINRIFINSTDTLSILANKLKYGAN